MGPLFTSYGAEFPGYDVLSFVNLTSGEIKNPMLGEDPNGLDHFFREALAVGGTATLWSGGPATPLLSLGGYGVWETLVPTGLTLVNASADGLSSVNGANLGNGDFSYLLSSTTAVPDVGGTAGLLALGTASIFVARFRRSLPSR